MVKIRLARGGVKNKPFYRIIVIESSKKRGGKALDKLGYWFPAKKELKIEKERLNAWIEKGAQVTKAVQDLLK